MIATATPINAIAMRMCGAKTISTASGGAVNGASP
jgi:hypothetical protein